MLEKLGIQVNPNKSKIRLKIVDICWTTLDGRGMLVLLGRANFGNFEILNNSGTSWKVKNLNLLDLEK